MTLYCFSIKNYCDDITCITSKDPGVLYSSRYYYLIKNSQAVKQGAAPKKAMVKKDVKSKVAAKKWL